MAHPAIKQLLAAALEPICGLHKKPIGDVGPLFPTHSKGGSNFGVLHGEEPSTEPVKTYDSILGQKEYLQSNICKVFICKAHVSIHSHTTWYYPKKSIRQRGESQPNSMADTWYRCRRLDGAISRGAISRHARSAEWEISLRKEQRSNGLCVRTTMSIHRYLSMYN